MCSFVVQSSPLQGQWSFPLKKRGLGLNLWTPSLTRPWYHFHFSTLPPFLLSVVFSVCNRHTDFPRLSYSGACAAEHGLLLHMPLWASVPVHPWLSLLQQCAGLVPCEDSPSLSFVCSASELPAWLMFSHFLIFNQGLFNQHICIDWVATKCRALCYPRGLGRGRETGGRLLGKVL